MRVDIENSLARLCEEQRAKLKQLAALEEFVAWQSGTPGTVHRSPIDAAADATIAIAKVKRLRDAVHGDASDDG